MKTDIFATRNDGSDMTGKRKKVMAYSNATPQPLFVEKDGRQEKIDALNKGDLVFMINDGDAKGIVDFLVVKFADTENHWLIFKGSKSNFSPADIKSDTISNVEGTPNVDKDGKLPSDKKIKNNYAIPLVAGIGGGVIGFLAAKRFNENVFACAALGLIVCAGLGYLATQMERKSGAPFDTGSSTVNIPDSK